VKYWLKIANFAYTTFIGAPGEDDRQKFAKVCSMKNNKNDDVDDIFDNNKNKYE